MNLFFERPEIFFSFISASWCGFLCIILLFKARSRGGLSFAALAFTIVVWQTGKLAKNLTLAYPIDLDIQFWQHVSFIGATFIYSTFFRMACRVSFRDRGIFRLLSTLGFLSSIAFVWLEYAGVLVEGVRITKYGYYHIPTLYYHVYLAVYFLFMAGAIFLFYPRFYIRLPQFRRQATVLFYGASAAFMLGGLEFIGIYTDPIFPIADLSPFVFSSILYWAIYRFNIVGGGDLVKTLLLRILYFALLFLITLSIYQLSVWVVASLDFPTGNVFLVSVISLILFLLTPVFLSIVNIVRQQFFPVRYSFSRLSAELSGILSRLETPEKMFESVLDNMKRVFGYQEGSALMFSYRNDGFDTGDYKVIGRPLRRPLRKHFFRDRHYPAVISRIEIFNTLRLGQLREKEKDTALMNLRQLNRLDTDLLLPVCAQNRMMGLLLFKQKGLLAESWQTVSRLLSSLSDLLGNHALQAILLKVKSEQDHLSKVGMITASLAHEIKNPLEGIYGAAQILNEQETENRKFVEMILNDTIRLNDLVQRFLQFSKFFEPVIREFNLVDVLKDFIERENAISGDACILIAVEGGALSVQADRDGLGQIILNLVQNARRFQPPGRPVTVRAEKTDSGLVISVEDQGPGVPPEDRERIFDPFFTTSVKSTGLGLAISQKIARAMGGNLYYEPLNPGSRFVLALKG